VSLARDNAHGISIASNAANESACSLQNRRSAASRTPAMPNTHATAAHGHNGNVL